MPQNKGESAARRLISRGFSAYLMPSRFDRHKIRNEDVMSVAVVEKIFCLLETLSRANHPLPLKQLADSTGLPGPTAHRLLQTLQTLGYVVRDVKSPDYLLGYRIQELARGPIQQRIKDAAAPLMHELHKTLNETIILGVREGLSIRYVDYLESTRTLRVVVRPSQTESLVSTALGRAVLSALSPLELDKILTAIQQETTAQMIPMADLEAIIAATRKRGWAEEDDEAANGISNMAISLKLLGYPDAAVSVSVPTLRCGEAYRFTIGMNFGNFIPPD